ncbi:Conserved hypothetical protein [Prochlorococcus marinus str. NATL2A]|uniref:Uncharacterized protein n=2 Tax=Prochlorococcus marinus TaxID=1219 RepID=A7MDB0_PROMT|nr:Hypothetical protein NATL1_01961 [Prochlorococcus marinus str. NATL1A]ABU23848.1 Conserved hypothetical protein [Prochlorococcus marinus str. NATL2A]
MGNALGQYQRIIPPIYISKRPIKLLNNKFSSIIKKELNY